MSGIGKFPLIFVLGAFLAHFSGLSALAAPTPGSSPDRQLVEILKREISKKIPGARIELTGAVHWTRGTEPELISSARVIGTTPRGEAEISVSDGEESAEGFVTFSAWISARVAARRVMPGEALAPGAFTIQDVNVASGQGYEYRGVILPAATEVAGLESRQTILEGQFLVSSAVKKIPDVRRGDVVRVNLVSNGVVLSTSGVAEEAAYLEGQIRVISQKTKRELVGRLGADKVVEVKL